MADLDRAAEKIGGKRRLVLLVTAAALFFLILPLGFWYFSWFGLPLDSAEVERVFAEPIHPPAAQGMVQRIAEKISRSDSSVRPYLPRLLELSRHQDAELRRTVAWAMGQHDSLRHFQPRLRELLSDPAPLVRRAAALSLAQFQDPAARPVLEAALKPHVVLATAAGKLNYRAHPGDEIKTITIIARINEIEVTAQVYGTAGKQLLPEGSDVTPGQQLMEIEPDPASAADIRRALSRLSRN